MAYQHDSNKRFKVKGVIIIYRATLLSLQFLHHPL